MFTHTPYFASYSGNKKDEHNCMLLTKELWKMAEQNRDYYNDLFSELASMSSTLDYENNHNRVFDMVGHLLTACDEKLDVLGDLSSDIYLGFVEGKS